MRKASTLVALLGLTSVGIAATTAHAQEPLPVAGMAVPSPAAAPRRNTELVVSFLPMGLGSFTGVPGGMNVTADASFAYGLGVSARWVVLPGLSVGITPQAIFNVEPKDQNELPWPVSREFDFFARVAYTVPVVDTIRLYAELMPGYSLIWPSNGDSPKGFVIEAGGGCAMDLTDRVFVDLGAGYQWGFQSLLLKGQPDPMMMNKKGPDVTVDARTKYLRVALGVGRRF
jgi:hypothetical protein